APPRDASNVVRGDPILALRCETVFHRRKDVDEGANRRIGPFMTQRSGHKPFQGIVVHVLAEAETESGDPIFILKLVKTGGHCARKYNHRRVMCFTESMSADSHPARA